MRRIPYAVVAGLLLVAAAWWLSRGLPEPSEPASPVPSLAAAAPSSPVAGGGQLPSLEVPSDGPAVPADAGGDEVCTPAVSADPFDGGNETIVRVSVAGLADGGEPQQPLLRLEFGPSNDGEDSIDWIAPAPVFHLRACDAVRMIVVFGPASEIIERPGRYELLDVRLDPGPSYVVTGRAVHRGRGLPDAGVRCPGGVLSTTDEDGRFRLDCHGRGYLSLEDPWRFSYPVYVKRVDDESLDVGERPVRRPPPIEPGKIGVGWDVSAAEPTALMVVAGTPAELAGLQPGDVLLEIDGHAIANLDEGMKSIPGPPGTPLRLKVRRGADIFLVDLIRQPELPNE